MVKFKLAEGEALIRGRSPQKARELLDAAEAAGIDPSLIRTTSGGYIVPKELGGEGGDATRLEIGHGLNEKKYRDGIDDAQVEATVGGELLTAIQPVADAGHVEAAILNQSEPTGAQTEGEGVGNGSQTVGDSAVLSQDRDPSTPQVTPEEQSPEGIEPNPAINPDATEQQETTVNEPFNPADHTVQEVNDFLGTASESERQRVLDAEANGKDRKTVAVPEESK